MISIYLFIYLFILFFLFYFIYFYLLFSFCSQSLSGAKTIESKKMDFNKKAKSKVNSFSNIGHVPGGGRVKVIVGSQRS